MPPEFLGVSTGRAGTVWIARVMHKAQIPTLHEQVYAGHGLENGIPEWVRPEKGEWSAQATPAVDAIGPRHVFHQVRDPLKVLASLDRFGLFHHPERFGAAGRNITRHLTLSGDPQVDAVRFWVEWNRRCDTVADLRWRVEDVDADLLVHIGSLVDIDVDPERAAVAIGSVDPTVNSRGTTDPFTLPDIPETARLEAMAASYGYRM